MPREFLLIQVNAASCLFSRMRIMCKETSEPKRLRELALQWREFAELGSSASRKDRLGWADYLVRLADQLEQKQKAEPPPAR